MGKVVEKHLTDILLELALSAEQHKTSLDNMNKGCLSFLVAFKLKHRLDEYDLDVNDLVVKLYLMREAL